MQKRPTAVESIAKTRAKIRQIDEGWVRRNNVFDEKSEEEIAKILNPRMEAVKKLAEAKGFVCYITNTSGYDYTNSKSKLASFFNLPWSQEEYSAGYAYGGLKLKKASSEIDWYCTAYSGEPKAGQIATYRIVEENFIHRMIAERGEGDVLAWNGDWDWTTRPLGQNKFFDGTIDEYLQSGIANVSKKLSGIAQDLS